MMKLKPWGNGSDYPEVFSADESNLLNHFDSGNAAAVRAFLSTQLEWLGYYSFQKSLLHLAAERDFPEVLAVLVELGLDVNTPQQKHPWGALNEAVLKGHLNSARWLLEHGAKTCHEYRGLTFSCMALDAVYSGNFDMVKLLVDHGLPVDILVDDPQKGLLTAAIDGEYPEIVDYLRSKGALTDDEIKQRTKAAAKPRKRNK